MREIILDVETTGLSPKSGHRIIEIAALEMINKNITAINFHTYLQPYRFVDKSAYAVHGISDEFLADKPRFTDILGDLIYFLQRSPIVAHNAQFDMSFLESEFAYCNMAFKTPPEVICTKKIAEGLFGKGGNRLDDLCKRFEIDTSEREKHGALVDCKLLAQVYVKLNELNEIKQRELNNVPIN